MASPLALRRNARASAAQTRAGRSAVPRAARHASRKGMAVLATRRIKSNGARGRRTTISSARNGQSRDKPDRNEATPPTRDRSQARLESSDGIIRRHRSHPTGPFSPSPAACRHRFLAGQRRRPGAPPPARSKADDGRVGRVTADRGFVEKSMLLAKFSKTTKKRDDDAGQRAAGDQAGRHQGAGAGLGFLGRELPCAVDQPAEHAPHEDRQRGRQRQVDADGERQRRDAGQLHHDRQHRPQDDQPPRQLPGHDPFDQRREESGAGAG